MAYNPAQTAQNAAWSAAMAANKANPNRMPTFPGAHNSVDASKPGPASPVLWEHTATYAKQQQNQWTKNQAAKKTAAAKAAAEQKRKAQQASAAKKKKPAAKKPSALDKYLAGDDTYQQQLANYNKEKSDYTSQYNRQKQIVGRDYSTTQRQMNKQAVDDRTQQANDFAGRGVLHSGVYAKALGDFNSDFNTKMTNLTQGKTDQLGDLSTDSTNFMRQIALELQAAKQDAIRRRAAKLGL
jgi:hypothetical protein